MELKKSKTTDHFYLEIETVNSLNWFVPNGKFIDENSAEIHVG